MDLHKSEIVENIAIAIWPIGGSGRGFNEALLAAQEGDPSAIEAIQVCYTMAEGLFAAVAKKVGRSVIK